MATTLPFTKQVKAVVPANGTFDAIYSVSVGLVFHLKHWLWQFTSVNFNLVDMRINNSTHLVEASIATPIAGAILQAVGSPNFNWRDFDLSLDIPSNGTLFITLQDLSGAQNTVNITLLGTMDFP